MCVIIMKNDGVQFFSTPRANSVGSISRPRPFLRINYTVDTCYVVSATKTNFLSCILHLRPSLVGYVTKLTHLW